MIKIKERPIHTPERGKGQNFIEGIIQLGRTVTEGDCKLA